MGARIDRAVWLGLALDIDAICPHCHICKILFERASNIHFEYLPVFNFVVDHLFSPLCLSLISSQLSHLHSTISCTEIPASVEINGYWSLTPPQHRAVK